MGSNTILKNSKIGLFGRTALVSKKIFWQWLLVLCTLAFCSLLYCEFSLIYEACFSGLWEITGMYRRLVTIMAKCITHVIVCVVQRSYNSISTSRLCFFASLSFAVISCCAVVGRPLWYIEVQLQTGECLWCVGCDVLSMSLLSNRLKTSIDLRKSQLTYYC